MTIRTSDGGATAMPPTVSTAMRTVDRAAGNRAGARLACALLIMVAALGQVARADATAEDARVAVDAVLTRLHALAAAGDFESYFDLYAPDAVFFGTDASERWNIAEFRRYAAGSKGWAYQMTARHIFINASGDTAWFDEELQNARFGATRGTGVLALREGVWKVVQYHLTIPIPNEMAEAVADEIRRRSQP